MLMWTEVDKKTGIAYMLEIEPENTPIKGNALASGDDAQDKKAEDAIRRQLKSGNLWAWCTVKVTAAKGSKVGIDYLRACSYRDTQGFLRGGYWEDMKSEATLRMK